MYVRTTKDGIFLTALRKFFAYNLAILGLIVLLRLYEVLFVTNFYGFPAGSWRAELIGFRYDLIVFLRISAFSFFPFLLLYIIKPVVAKIFYFIVLLIIALSTLGLIQYFARTSVLLGSDVFGYSREEISHTVAASGALSFSAFIPFVIFLGFAVVLIYFADKLKLKRTFSVLFALFVLICYTISFRFVPEGKNFKSEYDSYLAANKLSFFTTKSYDYFRKVKNEENLANNLNANTLANKHSKDDDFKYIDKEYPFLHQDVTPDVLGSFFNVSKEKPNIVFIIVESLGRSYSGDKASLGSFTPFLDSLAQKSLYWDNFLSTGGRTFAVMPSLLGSLPFGEKGFIEMGNNMPQFQGLLSLLKANGYSSGFYYGGDSKFDNMSIFFQRQQVDRIVDEKSFGNGYAKLPPKSNGFSWGYGDKELFRKYISDISKSKNSPRVDVMLTIGMHDPFVVNNQEFYVKKFEERISALKLNSEKQNFNRLYKQQLATVLYFNDALRYLITEYSKRDDFKNTIFVITGDHRMPEIPISTQIDQFHVPLVIYSPMLKRAQKFSSVSTQFDVTPSLLAFLRTNYKINLPQVASWLGNGLDIEVQFRNIHSYPLMRNKNELIDYLDKDYFLSDNTLYKIYPDLYIEPIANAANLKETQLKFETFKQMNFFACKKNRLVPDSLMKR